MTATRKAGRPKGSGADRTALLKLRVSPAELARYQAAATDLGVGLSEWAREAFEQFADDSDAGEARLVKRPAGLHPSR